MTRYLLKVGQSHRRYSQFNIIILYNICSTAWQSNTDIAGSNFEAKFLCVVKKVAHTPYP